MANVTSVPQSPRQQLPKTKFVTAEVHREFEQLPRQVTVFLETNRRRLTPTSSMVLLSEDDETGKSTQRVAASRLSPRLTAIADDWQRGDQQSQRSGLEETRLGGRDRSLTMHLNVEGDGRATFADSELDSRVTRRVRSCEERRQLERQRHHYQCQLQQQRRRHHDPLRITEFSSCGNDDEADDNNEIWLDSLDTDYATNRRPQLAPPHEQR